MERRHDQPDHASLESQALNAAIAYDDPAIRTPKSILARTRRTKLCLVLIAAAAVLHISVLYFLYPERHFKERHFAARPEIASREVLFIIPTMERRLDTRAIIRQLERVTIPYHHMERARVLVVQQVDSFRGEEELWNKGRLLNAAIAYAAPTDETIVVMQDTDIWEKCGGALDYGSCVDEGGHHLFG